MDIKQLQYFSQICKDGSFSRAAEHLFISQQGLSMSINRLESELGCSLLDRTTRSTIPNENGLWLLSRAEKIIALTDECELHFRNVKHKETIFLAANLEVLSIASESFRLALQNKQLPFHIRSQFGSGLECEELIDKGKYNLGFVCGPIDNSKYKSRLVARKDYLYLVNRNNKIAVLPAITLEELCQQKLILPGKDTKVYHEMVNICKERGIPFNIDMEIQDQAIIYNIVRNNLSYVGQVLDYFGDNLNDPVVKTFKLSDCDMKWELYIIWKQNHILSAAEQEFVDFALSSF